MIVRHLDQPGWSGQHQGGTRRFHHWSNTVLHHEILRLLTAAFYQSKINEV